MRGLIARIVVCGIAQCMDVTKRGQVGRGKNGGPTRISHINRGSLTVRGIRTPGLRKPTVLLIQPVGALGTTKYKEKT